MIRNNTNYNYSPNNAQNKDKNSCMGLNKTENNFYQNPNQKSR